MVDGGQSRMVLARVLKGCLTLGLVGSLAACGNGFGSGLFSKRSGTTQKIATSRSTEEPKSSIWDLFGKQADPNTTVEVNKYIWEASKEVLSFLPVEKVDPFSGVLVTGYGTPPGGGRAYRAIVYVKDPALDARSLKVSLMTKSGAVSPDTLRAVEDAILTRARQLRIQDSKL